MNRMIQTRLPLAALAVLLALPACSQISHYASEQQRDIKALDSRDVIALRQGHGMGFAKAAELNGYPGPMHTLELADPLEISMEQRTARRLMDSHKARARDLGEAIVAAEAALDQFFASKQATPESVSAATQRIAGLRAQLRAEHLNTHLAQTALLSPAQALRYSELRGYATATPSVNPAQHRGQTHRH